MPNKKEYLLEVIFKKLKTNSKKMGVSHHSPYRNDKNMMNLEGEIKNKNLFFAKEGQIIKI